MSHARTVVLAVSLAATAANAQWTVTNLHPAGASESAAAGVGPGVGGVRQVGYAAISGVPHAALWAGTSQWTDLHPAAAAGSVARGVSGSLQVGSIFAGSVPFAAAWTGTAASWQNLNPGQSSNAYGVHNGVAVGSYASSQTSTTACQWAGGVRASLNGASAAGLDDTQRVGAYRTGSFPLYSSSAALWTGNPSLGVNLQPPGAIQSAATGVHAGQQVGRVTLNGSSMHAALWTGSAASWVDLHPAGAANSECAGVFAGQQVGTARVFTPADPTSGTPYASLWTGTASSWTNLHSFLPPSFSTSTALGIYSDATRTYVVGSGFNTITNRTEALLWTRDNQPSCGSADFNGDGDIGTDADIEAFFACLGGNCCPACAGADFNGDGDIGTDADIEAFFRVLAGGSC